MTLNDSHHVSLLPNHYPKLTESDIVGLVNQFDAIHRCVRNANSELGM